MAAVGGLALTGIATVLVDENADRQVQEALNAQSEALAGSLGHVIDQHLQALVDARALIGALPPSGLDRRTWRRFVVGQELDQRLRGLFGVAWVECVDRDALVEFESAVAAEYPSDLDFAVRAHPSGPGKAPDGQAALVIRYHEPLELNAEALGVDLATAPGALSGLLRARDTGRPATSPPMRLAQDGNAVADKLVFYVPVYDTPQVPATIAERRAALRGFIAGPMNLQQILEDETLGPADGLALAIVDAVDGVALARVTPHDFDTIEPRVAMSSTSVAGREWLVTAAKPAGRASTVTVLTAVTGTALSLALATLLAALARAGRLGAPRPRGAQDAANSPASLASRVLDSLRYGVAVLATDGSPMFANRAWREDGEGQGQQESNLGELLWAAFESEVPTLLAGKHSTIVRELCIPGDRRPRQVVIRVSAIETAQGPALCVTCEDVTLRRHAEQQLLRSRNMLEATTRMSQVGGWELDIDRSELHWADEAFRIHELPLGEQPGLQDAIEFFESGAQSEFRRTIDNALVRGQGWDLELPLVTARGNRRWIRTVGRAERSEGRTVRIQGSYQDVTERRADEDRLRLSEERFRLIAEHATDGIWDWDLKTGQEYLSPSFKALFGYADHELPNTPEGWQRIILAEDRELLEQALQAHVERGEDFAVPVRFNHKQAGIVWVICRGQAIFDNDGTAVRVVGTHTDITQLKHTEAELERAREAAEAGSRSKSEFLANMSHEIRTPITAILGFVDLLATRDDLDTESADFLETIERNGRHLLEIIDDILDLSKIEAGRMAVERREVDPAALLEEVRELLEVRARGHGLELTVSVDEDVPERIESDALRLRQILLNLVGNAIKFTESGSVQVHASCDQGAERPRLRIEVIDTGVGVEPDAIDRLFRPFTQADDSHTRTFGGTGLGLTISQRLAGMLGGEIEVRSTPGQGSTFTVTVDAGACAGKSTGTAIKATTERPRSDPAAEPESSPAAEPESSQSDEPLLEPADIEQTQAALPAKPLTGRRILVAEDGPDNQRLIQLYLTRAGAEVSLVDNGRDAVDALQSPQSRFDALLLDMQMPVLDGYGAASELRALGNRIPIVALTAHAMGGDRERCIAAGCDEYATKPIDPAAMIASINRALSSVARRG
ncbi:Autoinducer 2 sensor kinase/phosphatase LuxQ [Planctomycetes bacterium Pla86]|uniref:histidine kinase n=2 Tax=Engelhardtia mirabilis TaxID=2528011 RepID=A0A518BQB7_9BACT|nr:Autoinducer 2 sensor kinase/phosphatase LuxQ [Planctomycetes bacterium Pla133]QDV03477.1 Autoinducer 2 sensor kinase/phosphatase LuxQ [Planctomycetes bacterium Pla86]